MSNQEEAVSVGGHIRRVEIVQVNLPPKVKRTDAIQSFVTQETPMVRVTCDDGATGVGAHAALSESHGARPTLILSADAGADVRAAVHEAGLPLLMKPLKPLALKSVLDRLLAARAVT